MKGYCRARRVFVHPRKFVLLGLPPAELGNWLNVFSLCQPSVPLCQNGLFFFSPRNAGIKLWLLPIWIVLSSSSTKLSNGQKMMDRTIPLKFQEKEYNWTRLTTKPASITFIPWNWLLLRYSESLMLSGYRRPLHMSRVQLVVTTSLYSWQ